MNTRLPFACEFSVPYLVCVTERSMFFKDLKLESDFFFFPLPLLLQMAFSSPSVFMLFLQYLSSNTFYN